MEIKEHIEAISHAEVRDHFLTIEENKEPKELYTSLTALDTATTELRDKATSLLDECYLFIGLIKGIQGFKDAFMLVPL